MIRHAGELPRVVREAMRRVPGARATILIDGPSASGKSALAESIIRFWPNLVLGRSFPEPGPRGADDSAGFAAPQPAAVVHMDDLYPGWGGLEAGGRQIVDEILVPRSRGLPGRWRSFDWERDEPGSWRIVPAEGPLVVEGCGCLSRRSARLADLCVWVDAEETVRQRRFSRRDRGAFDHEWTHWENQMEAFIAREHPRDLADVLVWSA